MKLNSDSSTLKVKNTSYTYNKKAISLLKPGVKQYQMRYFIVNLAIDAVLFIVK